MRLNLGTRSRLISLWLLAVSVSASAHHGISAQFDSRGDHEIEGVISQITWRNPHVLFNVNVRTPDGQETLWQVETLSASMMRKNDISRDVLRVGDRVRVAGLPSVRGRNEIYVTNLLLPDGQEVLFNARVEPRWSDRVIGHSGPNYAREGDSSAPEAGIFRVWSSTAATPAYYSSLNLDSNPLAPRPSTPSASAQPPLGRTTATDCSPKGMPSAMAQPYPMEFVRQGNNILLRLEEYDAVRTIRMGADSSTETQPPSLLGNSTGRWEGDTLVVTTKQVSEPTMGGGIRISPAAEFLERFTASSDGSRLDYQMTITDPTLLAEPVVLQKYWLYVPGVTVQPYECIPGG